VVSALLPAAGRALVTARPGWPLVGTLVLPLAAGIAETSISECQIR
jgi:hypothetical protein